MLARTMAEVITSDTELDALSGAATRAALMRRLREELEEALSELKLVLIDLDRFRALNVGRGPDLGDPLLSKMRRRLLAAIPEARMIARVHGDGFAVLVRSARPSLEHARDLAEVVSRPFALRGQAVSLGFAIGVATASAELATPERLLQAAEAALQAAKERPFERIAEYRPALIEAERTHQDLETDLRASLRLEAEALQHAAVARAFEVWFQPVVAQRDGRVCGLEALIRWLPAERGTVAPAALFEVADRIGVTEVLTRWMIPRACEQFVASRAQLGLPQARLAINLAPADLLLGDRLLRIVRAAVDAAGLRPEEVDLEVPDLASVRDLAPEAVLPLLLALRRHGFRIVLDQFGRSGTHLMLLEEDCFDAVKIDRSIAASFLEDDAAGAAEQDPASARIASGRGRMLPALVAFVRALDLEVCVVGLETAEQVARLAPLGVDRYQGFAFSPALPPVALVERLARLT